jgi:hypothetical protein
METHSCHTNCSRQRIEQLDKRQRIEQLDKRQCIEQLDKRLGLYVYRIKLQQNVSTTNLDSIRFWFTQNFIRSQPCQLLLPYVLHVLYDVCERAQLLGSVTQEA